jgi:hypothetical protein
MQNAKLIWFALAALVSMAPGQAVLAQSSSRERLIPHASWDCGMPEGIAVPELGQRVLEIVVPLERAIDMGQTQYGMRRVAVGLEGSVTGPKFSGAVAQGALDFELTLGNGVVEIEQVLVLQAADGSYLYVRTAGTGPTAGDVRVVMDFEAPNASEHAWLNSGKFVARREIDTAAMSMRLAVYDVTAVAAGAGNGTSIVKPAGVAPQPWGYRSKRAGEQQGEILITENVTLAPSQRVGESKRGDRNIIPITGGTVSGRITGKVLMGGADYQILSPPPATIDAHYLWQTDDGETIIVRNGGSFGGLVPTFEARVDGRYSYLNTGSYLSSNPGRGEGGVALTFYESTGAR